jgi:quercetin dioxygenase-like cupin family protein
MRANPGAEFLGASKGLKRGLPRGYSLLGPPQIGEIMATAQQKSLDQPDETRPVEKGRVEVVELDVGTVMRTIFEPGWRWSECVKPIVGGESCQIDHFGYCISGRLHVQMENGEEFDVGPADAMRIPPGHDAWVVGDEPYVGIDFTGGPDYAKAGS